MQKAAPAPDLVPEEFKVPFAWLDGKVVDSAAATVPLMAYTLHYGLGVFEGIRSYDGAKGPACFRLKEHMDRLHRSAGLVRMQLPYTVEELVRGTCDVLGANKMRSGYVRPIAFVDDGKRGLGALNNRVRIGICVWPWGTYLGDEGVRNGIRCQIASISRMSAASFLPKGKICGQYVNSILAKRLAIFGGYDESILLDERGFVSEASGENIFVVKNGEILTPPSSSSILEGITRDAVMQMAASMKIPCRELSFSREGLITADEIFLSGTAAEITPVREVDGHSIGNGGRGPVTERIQNAYKDAVMGKLEGFEGWLSPYKV